MKAITEEQIENLWGVCVEVLEDEALAPTLVLLDGMDKGSIAPRTKFKMLARVLYEMS